MKALKIAAVVAGSMAIAGAAAPAFASSDLPPMSLNGGVNDALTQVTNQPLASPIDTNLLDPKHEKGLLGTVAGAAKGLHPGGAAAPLGMLGGLPLGK
ncbi:hypothetical protein ACIREE_17800 [Streptomyces sp. NPDC102467]|uniref:hypothetical protein n=1 Tax=Streptomyces sp. NPDC102467 TaxID=3366179 RepID=UPI0038125B1C